MINRKTALRLWEALGDGRDSVTNTSMIALRWVGWDPNESIKLFNEFLDQSTESFQEEDHPRDRDGKFTDKGNTSSKTVRELAKDVTVYSYKELIQKHSDRGYGYGEQWHNDLTNPIKNKEDLKTFYEAKQKWEKLLKTDEPLRLGFNKIKEDMTEYNGMLKNKSTP